MKRIINIIILILLFQSGVYSQNIICGSSNWSYSEIENNEVVKFDKINEPTLFIFQSYCEDNTTNFAQLTFYENSKDYQLKIIIIQKLPDQKNTYYFKVFGTDNIIHGVSFNEGSGILVFNKELIEIIFIGEIIKKLEINNYNTEISIE